MSNRPHRRTRQPRPDKALLDLAIQLTSAARGCNCQPDITTQHGSTTHARIAHDETCPAADTGTAIALIPPPRSSK